MLAYSNLFLFILMGSINIYLLLLLKERRQIQGPQLYGFGKEMCVLVITLFFFEMSYLLNFMNDKVVSREGFEENIRIFAQYIIYDSVCLFNGSTFLALLAFHYKNFIK